MKNMKKVAKTVGALGLVGCAAMSSPYAMAEDTFWTIGGSIGQSGAKIDDARIASRLPGSVSISNDDSDTAFKLFGGYQFNKNFALEAGYFNLGKFGYTATTVPAGTLSGNVKIQGMNLDAVGIMPIDDNFSVFGRLGFQYGEAKAGFSSTGVVPVPANPSPSKNFKQYKAGLGVQYDFNETLGMRLEAERYRVNDAVGSDGDINMYSVGLIYRFNEKKPAPVQKAAAPVAAAAPVFIYVPVKAKTEQYCSVLDLNFEINADEMQRDDKEKLATLGTFLNKYPGTIAVIEGHTDNVGSAEKNMELSQRRADSVVKYLVDELHVTSALLVSKGYGETRPIADNSTREGQQMNRRIGAIIGCAPDLEGLTVAPTRMTMALEMDFDPKSAEIDPQYRGQLAKVANFMKVNPSVTATVEGHSGKAVGIGTERVAVSPELAMEISKRRAQNVVNYLADNLGISRSRLSAEGYGSTRRVAYGLTLEGQEENRRVNIIFNYKPR